MTFLTRQRVASCCCCMTDQARDAVYTAADEVKQRNAACAKELAEVLQAVFGASEPRVGAATPLSLQPLILMQYLKELMDCELNWPESSSTSSTSAPEGADAESSIVPDTRRKGAFFRAMDPAVVQLMEEHARWIWNYRFFGRYGQALSCCCC